MVAEEWAGDKPGLSGESGKPVASTLASPYGSAPPTMPQLIFRYDDGGEEVFSLEDPRIGVGRGKDNPIVIDHDYISHHHARLEREGGGYRITDLGSNNGTYVNDRSIGSVRLRNGDTIRFGVFEVHYRESEEAESVADVPDEAVVSEIARLEARRSELQALFVEEHRRLEEIRARAIPAAEAELSLLRDEANRELASLERLRSELADGRRVIAEREVEAGNLVARIEELRASSERAHREHETKRLALAATVSEWLDAEGARDQLLARLEDLKVAEAAALGRTEGAKTEHDQLVARNKALVAAVHAAEQELDTLRRSSSEERQAREALEKENEDLRQRAAQTRNRLEMAEARVSGKIRDWSEFESGQLTVIVDRKTKLEEQCSVTEARLARARDELAELRERTRREMDQVQAALEDLKVNHYEPTRELHAELTMRNEELANEVARKEERLRRLETSISEGRETERIVIRDLERKGQTLVDLEQRLGEEAARVATGFVSLQRPASAAKPPRLADLGQIFVPNPNAPRPVVPPGSPAARNAGGRHSLVVFDPNSQNRSLDFTGKVELDIAGAPLPVGFTGLAAATRGAFFTSLARTVEAARPVLLVAGEELAETYGHLKKLRAALPGQILLLGWRASTFVKVTESLDSGTNFQDLVAMLSLSDGSLTTDPYMNTFFDSLNQGKRFLFLPPALPWNPQARPPHAARSGIQVDISAFQPDDDACDGAIAELKEIVESTRQLLTIPEVSKARVRRVQERLELGADWVRVVPVPGYADGLAALERHLAVVSFEPVGFDQPLLRDVLLTGTLPLFPVSEGLQTFFPGLAMSAQHRVYPDPTWIAQLFEEPARYAEVIQTAERALLERHSYQAVARQLDAFMEGLRR